MAELQTTSLNRGWVIKTGIFMLVLFIFGIWGLFDAMYLYPKRGLADASFQYKTFLTAADKAGRLTTSNLTVTEPAKALADLNAKEEELNRGSSGETGEARKAQMDLAMMEWLESLKRAWRLNPDPKPLGLIGKPADRNLFVDLKNGEAFTTPIGSAERTVVSPQALLNELTTFWNTNPKPSALSGFDMLTQWVFVGVGLIGGVWILLTILKARSRVFTWDAEAKRLTIPGGASVTPSELSDIDKRLWHKYYATLVTTAGASHKLDLLRYVPLEEWVLEMERIRFPERAAEEKAEEKKDETEKPQDDPAEENPAAADPNT